MPKLNLSALQQRYDAAIANHRATCDYFRKAEAAKRATLMEVNKVMDEITKLINIDKNDAESGWQSIATAVSTQGATDAAK